MAAAIDTSASGWTLAAVTDGSSNTTITGNVPANVVNGDLMIAIVQQFTGVNPTNITPPAGWTEVFYPGYLNGNFTVVTGVWRRIASSEPASYDWTLTASNADDQVTIIRVTGHDATTPIDVASADEGPDSRTTFTCPSLTTATDNALVVSVVVAKDGNVLTGVDSGYPTSTTGLFSRRSRTSSNGINLGVAYELRATAGASGTRAWSSYLSSARIGNAISFAIRSAAGGGSTPRNLLLMGCG